jgi:hypothetical protein
MNTMCKATGIVRQGYGYQVWAGKGPKIKSVVQAGEEVEVDLLSREFQSQKWKLTFPEGTYIPENSEDCGCDKKNPSNENQVPSNEGSNEDSNEGSDENQVPPSEEAPKAMSTTSAPSFLKK